MANTHVTLKELFKNIANMIREKEGSTEDIPVSEFADRIANMNTKDLFVEIVTGTVTTIKASELDGVTTIQDFTFTGCDSLESVTLPSSITSIGSYAFIGCGKISTINVPWAEGDISDAPWGATNATINYNYGGESK